MGKKFKEYFKSFLFPASVKVQYSQSFPRTAPPPKVGLRRFRMQSQNKDNEEHLELPPIQPGQYPEQHESSGSLKSRQFLWAGKRVDVGLLS